MVLGGIPFYWDEVMPGRSAMQNIGDICFLENGLLRTEYQNLFQSLFKNFSKHERIIGSLRESGFIRKYALFVDITE